VGYVCPVIVSTINVNGIRAAIKQRSEQNLGLLPWLANTPADVVCLQEVRADDDQLAAALAPVLADSWHLASAGGDLKGRNGVAILSHRPIMAKRDLGVDEFALHGRYLEVDIAGLTVASVYVQTGEAGTDRQLEGNRQATRGLAARAAAAWVEYTA
jgi:exodeoxyribonuclease III